MKRVYILFSWLVVGVFIAQIQAMQIVSQSKFPLTVYYMCPEQVERSVTIAAGTARFIDQACCVTTIELQGYLEYNIVQKDSGACAKSALFTIVPEVDQVFVLKAYNENNIQVLEFLLKNGLDPLAQLSNAQITSSMILDNNILKPSGILAPMVKLRGATSGNGMQHYKALLPAARYDKKTDIEALLKRYVAN